MLDLSENYINNLNANVDVMSDDAHVAYHVVCALRTYFLFLVDKSIFVDKSLTYVDIVYIEYFMDMDMIHEYN